MDAAIGGYFLYMNFRRQTLRIYTEHLRPYKGRVFFSWLALLFAQLTGLIPPLLYKQFFDVLTGFEGPSAEIGSLVVIIIWVVVAYVMMNVFYRIAEYLTISYVAKTAADLYQTCFSYLHQHSHRFFTNNFAGSLVKRVNRFARSFQVLFDSLYWDLHGIIVRIIVPTVVLCTINIWLGLILFVWSVFFIFVAYLFIKQKLKWDTSRAEQDSKVTGVLADTIVNELNVKLFTGFTRETKRFAEETREQQRLVEGSWGVNFNLNLVQGFLLLVVEFAMMYYGLLLWQQGLFTIGDFVLMQAYMNAIIIHVWDSSHIMRRLYEALADAEEMTEIFETPHEITDAKNATTLAVDRGEIVFEKAQFAYNKTRTIFKDFNLHIMPGEKIALVGPSGAGKSTIVRLLMRQYEVTGGKILIDGQRLLKATLESVWANMSYVPQDPILFHRTLIENIRYGRPDATDEEVKEAAKQAHCHEFISEFQDGYDTYVGERGVKLSGGERQRVAIARAILRNSPILILDEATSSLDSESERLIQDALNTLMKGKTVIVIAHRLSTIMAMDRILVIEGGEIVEEGTHKQLLRKKRGTYKKLWDIQAGTFV